MSILKKEELSIFVFVFLFLEFRVYLGLSQWVCIQQRVLKTFPGFVHLCVLGTVYTRFDSKFVF